MKSRLLSILLFSALWSHLISGTPLFDLRFQEGSTGASFKDSSGNSRTATCDSGSSACPVMGGGKYGNELFFDGSNDYLSIASGGGLNANADGTISLWVKWMGTQDAGFSTFYGCVLGRQWDGVANSHVLGLNGNDPATAKIIWGPYGYASVGATGASAVGDNRWHHVVISYSGGSHKIYLDGVQDGSTGNLNSTPFDDATKVLSIGAWIGGGACYSTSKIRNVTVWDEVLTSRQVAYLFEVEHPNQIIRTQVFANLSQSFFKLTKYF